jgi:mono/diheme cytochrome c family protein
MKQHFSGWIVVLALTAAVPATHASSRAQRTHGAELFNANGCVHCHTIGSVGGNKGPNLSGVGRTAAPAAMRKQIVEGGKGMPAFGEVLEPKDIEDVIAYLRSCKAKPKKQ